MLPARWMGPAPAFGVPASDCWISVSRAAMLSWILAALSVRPAVSRETSSSRLFSLCLAAGRRGGGLGLIVNSFCIGLMASIRAHNAAGVGIHLRDHDLPVPPCQGGDSAVPAPVSRGGAAAPIVIHSADADLVGLNGVGPGPGQIIVGQKRLPSSNQIPGDLKTSAIRSAMPLLLLCGRTIWGRSFLLAACGSKQLPQAVRRRFELLHVRCVQDVQQLCWMALATEIFPAVQPDLTGFQSLFSFVCPGGDIPRRIYDTMSIAQASSGM